jgi:hypothetical protein
VQASPSRHSSSDPALVLVGDHPLEQGGAEAPRAPAARHRRPARLAPREHEGRALARASSDTAPPGAESAPCLAAFAASSCSAMPRLCAAAGVRGGSSRRSTATRPSPSCGATTARTSAASGTPSQPPSLTRSCAAASASSRPSKPSRKPARSAARPPVCLATERTTASEFPTRCASSWSSTRCRSSPSRRSVRSRSTLRKPGPAPPPRSGTSTPEPQNRPPPSRRFQHSFPARPSARASAASASGAPRARSSGVKVSRLSMPRASARLQPSRFSAPAFQLVTRRSGSVVKMA